jgi:lactoylglutathione lyase
MRYLHTMIRVSDPVETLRFFGLLGLREVRRMDNEQGRFTLIFLAAPGDEDAQIELTHNWDGPQAALSPGEGSAARGAADLSDGYGEGRNFGHVAYEVDDVYATCARLMEGGVTINRPPREGRMAFVRTPDGISIELLQKGGSLPVAEPWASMPNVGHW